MTKEPTWIEEFHEKFGNVPKENTLINGGREVCLYCGHPASGDKVFKEIESFIASKLREAEGKGRNDAVDYLAEHSTAQEGPGSPWGYNILVSPGEFKIARLPAEESK